MSVSVFDHPLLSNLLGDEEAASCFSLEADLAAMLAFEKALAKAGARAGVVPDDAANEIVIRLNDFEPQHESLREGARRDGTLVPALIKQSRSAVGEKHGKHVHFGSTSQDVVDTSLALRLKRLLEIYDARLGTVIAALDGLNERFGQLNTMGHTRMQAAIPVAASRKILSWRDPLLRERDRLEALKAELLVLHFGGPAGTLEKLGDKAEKVGKAMAEDLGLRWLPRPRHSERDGIVEFASWLSLVTGSLGKMGQDIALMAQNEMGEVSIASGGGSSAMPHKVNPVGAETLVTLARFNATLVSGMHQAMVHENERSGTAWTLEWMLLPQMAVATAAALSHAQELLGSVSFVETD